MLEAYIHRVVDYVQTLTSSRKYLHSRTSTDRGIELVERGRLLVRERYHPHTERILDEAAKYRQAATNDALTQQLTDLMASVRNTALYDA